MSVTMRSVQLLFPLSTSMLAVFNGVPAAQFSLSGVEYVGLTATGSYLPPSFCLLHVLTRWHFSPHLLHLAVYFLQQSLLRCPGIPHTKQFPLLKCFLKSRITASATENFVPGVSVLCSHECSQPFPQLYEVRCWQMVCIYPFHCIRSYLR